MATFSVDAIASFAATVIVRNNAVAWGLGARVGHQVRQDVFDLVAKIVDSTT